MNIEGVPLIYLSSIITFCIGGFIYFDGISICKSGTQRQRSVRELEEGKTAIVEVVSENTEVIKAGVQSKFYGALGLLIGIVTACIGFMTS